MRFTLKLTDYIDQYKQNLKDKVNNCPVCYMLEINGDTRSDVRHILECYKSQVIELTLISYFDSNGFYPELDDLFIDSISQRVEREILEVSSKLLH